MHNVAARSHQAWSERSRDYNSNNTIIICFMVTSFHGQTIPFHRSFYSFSVKLNVKCTFFCLWLKERGVHMRSSLFFYRLMKSSMLFDMTINPLN